MLEYRIVAQQPGKFCGWPANHGAWQWDGKEFLVGFLQGDFDEYGAMHNIRPPLVKLQARSLDAGETWAIEQPNVDFSCSKEPDLKPPVFGLTHSIIRVCGNYDTGGMDCVQQGGFYLSSSRGQAWSGPYAFKGLWPMFQEQRHNTSRTCTLGSRVFLSTAKQNSWGTDWVFESDWNGYEFTFLREVCRDGDRAVMPAVAEITTRQGNRRLCALRRKSTRNWIDIFASDNDGDWFRVNPYNTILTGGWNGNPPALAAVDGRFYLAYANRAAGKVYVMISEDRGINWKQLHVLRETKEHDIGYPRLFTRHDGKLVCVYYMTTTEQPQGYVEACIFE